MALPMLSPGMCLAGRFRIEALIGSGGYATVYHAIDLQLNVPRAVKEVSDPDAALREQFSLEAQLLITSNHPNIPRGYATFEENGRVYLVMDYVEGKDLEQLLSESLTQTGKPLDEAQALRWLLPICDVLEVMHTRVVPIIHRDIKPANIKLNGSGVPVLIDFGLAKLSRPGPTNQAAQGVTPGYAPPEQYLAQGKTDARTDIYAVGATLYTLLVGREPAEAPNRLLVQSGNSGQPLIPARMINPSISAATARIIDKAMDISPSQRQQSAAELRGEMLLALDQLETGRTIVPNGVPTGPLPVPSPTAKSPAVRSGPSPAPQPPLFPAAAPIAATVLPAPLPRYADKRLGQGVGTAWIDLGGPQVQRWGKLGIIIAAIELYWGLLCTAALAGIVGTSGFTRSPAIPLIIGAVAWVLLVIMLTVIVVRAVDRPIARRGQLTDSRRGVQGTLLILLWLGINALALIAFSSFSGTLLLFGLGFLGLASILTGLLTTANVLG
jgi:hypothetical protein